MIQKSEPSFDDQINFAATSAAKVLPPGLEWALIPATGPTELVGRLADKARIDGQEIAPGLLDTTILWGRWQGRPVLVTDPPPAPWEPHSASRCLFLFRFLAAIGIRKVIISTACATLSPGILPAGGIGIIRDHLDFSGGNPLTRANPGESGAPMFPDLTRAYDPGIRQVAANAAPAPVELVIAAVSGPSLPTPAEYTFYRNCGADVAAMHGPGEVIAAVQAGLQVALLAAATQEIDLPNPAPADLETMMVAAEDAAPRLTNLMLWLIEEKK